MKTLLFFFVISTAIAQSYEETLDRCTDLKNYSSADLGDQIVGIQKCIAEKLPGKAFPAFTVVTQSGSSISSNDLKGKVVLINFWFTTCAPCVAEIPILNELTNEYADKDFVLISFLRDSEKEWQSFSKRHSLKYEVVLMAEAVISQKFKMTTGYPTTILLNREGEVVSYKSGGPMEEPGLAAVKKEYKKNIDEELSK